MLGINSFATGGITPDITFLLDIDPAEGLRRVGHPQLRMAIETADEVPVARLDQDDQRKFEEQSLVFHRRVRKGYLTLARQDPKRWVVVEAHGSEEDIVIQIWRHVNGLLQR